MEKTVLAAVAAALMSSVGALHPESAHAADSAPSVYEDSTVDASLDPGEERVSVDADNQARLKDLRYAYFIGYNARAREDSKSYATLGDEVKHPQKPLPPAAVPASPPPVAGRVATPRRVAAQTPLPRQVSVPVAPAKQVSAPIIPPKRVVAVRATPARQVVAHVEPVPLKRVPAQVAPVTPKHVYAQVEPLPPRRVSAPVVPLKQASVQRVSVQVTPPTPKRAEVPPAPLKQVSTRTTPPKLFGAESEPPILIPTQAVRTLPAGNDDDAQVTQSRDSEEYAGREYAPPPPPPPRTVQANQYAPAQYQPAYAQSAYVPRPPAQAAAQQVVIVGRPPAYPVDNQMYTPPELRHPYPAGYATPAQPAGYQGWE
jgi:hypothetical protein